MTSSNSVLSIAVNLLIALALALGWSTSAAPAASAPYGRKADPSPLGSASGTKAVQPAPAQPSSGGATVSVSIADGSAAESSENVLFTVTRSGDLDSQLVLDYIAVAGPGVFLDPTRRTGSVAFYPGSNTATIRVFFSGNGIYERSDRTFSVQLTGVVNLVGPPTAHSDFTSGRRPMSVAIADINGDGRPDLVVANYYSNTVSVLLNTTAPGAAVSAFAPMQSFPVGPFPTSVAIGDFNGDGKLDLAVTYSDSFSSSVAVLLNTTSPGSSTVTFAAAQAFPTALNPLAVAIGDFNGDGRPDLAVANFETDSVSILLNTTASGATSASFAGRQEVHVLSNGYPASVAIGDFNGDGKPDLAVANYNADSVSVMLNMTASGSSIVSFSPQREFATAYDGFPTWVAIGDVNGDGRPDLVVSNGNTQNVSVLLNTTAGGATIPSFAGKVEFLTGHGPGVVTVADLNGDGKPDLAVPNSEYGGSGDSVSVLLNTTESGAVTPSFTAHRDFLTGTSPTCTAVGDFNADGKPDIAVTNYYSDSVTVLLDATAADAAPTVTIARGTAVGTIVNSDPPTIAAVAGRQQTVAPGSFFGALEVLVTDGAGHPVGGIPVTFIAGVGSNGASGTFASPLPVLSDANGFAIASALTANSKIGSFAVTATVPGVEFPVSFNLSIRTLSLRRRAS